MIRMWKSSEATISGWSGAFFNEKRQTFKEDRQFCLIFPS